MVSHSVPSRSPFADGGPTSQEKLAETTAQSAEASALQALEEDIAFGKRYPRERLIEDDLIAEFGLKRHVVRSVLSELVRMGLAERVKHQGVFVRSYTLKEVQDLYVVRDLLESTAASLIPYPVEEDRFNALVDIQKTHDRAILDHDLHAVFRTNLQFHTALFSLCNNEVLARAIQEHARQAHPIRSLMQISIDYRERSRADHWAMIEAVRQGQREELVRLCREHLEPSREAYVAFNQHVL